MNFSVMSEDAVFKCLLDIKSNAMGYDNFNNVMFLLYCPVNLPLVVHIINEGRKPSTVNTLDDVIIKEGQKSFPIYDYIISFSQFISTHFIQ